MEFESSSDISDDCLAKSARSDCLGRKHITVLGSESPEPLRNEDIVKKKTSATIFSTTKPPMDVFDAAAESARSVEVKGDDLEPFYENFLQWLKEKSFHGVYFESKERELKLETRKSRDFVLCVYAYFCAVYHDLDKALLYMKHILNVRALQRLVEKIEERKRKGLVADVERIHEQRKKNGMDIVKNILPEGSVHTFQPVEYCKDGDAVTRLFLCGGPEVPVVIGLLGMDGQCDLSCNYVCRIKRVFQTLSSEGFFYAQVEVIDSFVRT